MNSSTNLLVLILSVPLKYTKKAYKQVGIHDRNHFIERCLFEN